MRLPITDKFLWRLYEFIEKADDIANFAGPRTMTEAIYPDVRRLRHEYKKEKARRSFNQLISYLRDQGYIKAKNLELTEGVILTPKGMGKILKIKRRIKNKKKRRDGHLIMIIFDIPENKRMKRDFLRSVLMELGYEPLQKSVWVSPYDVYKETEEAVRSYKIIPYVKLFLIKELT